MWIIRIVLSLCLCQSALAQQHSNWWTDGGDVVESPTLRTIAITPFGAWFQHQAEGNPYSPTLLWSSRPFDSADEAEGSERWWVKQRQAKGEWTPPHYTISWTPDTTYYVRVQRRGSLTEMIKVHTRPLEQFPQQLDNLDFALNPATLAQLQQGFKNGDMKRWIGFVRQRGRQRFSGSRGAHYAFATALLYRITERKGDLQAALLRWNDAVAERDGIGRSNSSYRYKSTHLSFSTALLWKQLTSQQREQALLALIDDDEQPLNLKVPLDDTDRHIASTHIQLFSGLLARAPEFPKALKPRFEAVYETGLRAWEGVFKAKMRLDGVKYGLSGGTMDDGSDYGVGTAMHWLEIFWAFDQLGSKDIARYAPWIRNHIRQKIHLVLPDGSGRFSYGDVERADQHNNGSSYKPDWSSNTLLAYFANQYGYTQEANHLYAMMEAFNGKPSEALGGFELLENPALRGPQRIPLDFVDSGVGMLFSRTSWESDASAVMVQFGWRGVHHSQEDVGHISWWSDGAWKLHEIPHYGYDQAAGKHNVPPGQFGWGGTASEFSPLLDYTSSPSLLQASLRLDNAYDSTKQRRRIYQRLLRTIQWDKTADVITVEDRFEGGPVTDTPWIGPASVTREATGNLIRYEIR